MQKAQNIVERAGSYTMERVSAFGATWLFLANVIARSLRPPFRLSLIIQQLNFIGF